MTQTLCLLMLSLVMVSAPWAGAANTLYVAPNGSDTNPGSEAQPLATLKAALTRAGAGDTVYLKAGTHEITGALDTLTKPLTIIGEDRDTTILTKGQALSFTQSLTVKNLTLRAGPWLQPAPPAGSKLDGIVIDNCIFESGWAGLHARDYKGEIVNVSVSNCEFRNLEGGKVVGIAIFRGLVSGVRITKCSFRNLKSTQKGCSAVFLGDLKTSNDLLVADNTMDTISGPATFGSVGAEVHGIICYGTSIRIERNTVRNLNAGTDHEAIYIKGRSSVIADNLVENCGSGGGGADIASKGGDFSVDNVYSGNRVISDQPGCGMFIAGGAIVRNNYVKKTNGANGIDCYPLGKPLTIADNYAETKSGAGIYVNDGDDAGRPFEWPDPGEVVVTNNVAISYERSPIKVENAKGAKISGNTERKGRE